ncbi:MAG: type IV secretory system conjugative DNA transfer family protein [Bacteroidetes bacterium]|nr:type IV secretory system conjugative DNA transfer family protein [Bacteroidota bacterium]
MLPTATRPYPSILATAKASLTLFTDETVASITSIDTIDFSEFRTKRWLCL